MGTLSTKVVPHDGLFLATADYAAASASGDNAATGSGVFLIAKNSDSAASHTVTLAVPTKVDNLAVSPRVVTVPASDMALIPLTSLYRNPATGLAAITYDDATKFTVAVARVA